MNINDLIAKKTNLITKYYKTLENLRSISLDEFLNDYSQQLLAERLLYLITQTAVDINQQILSIVNSENSHTTLESFTQLAKYQIITPDLAQKLAPSTGLIKHLTYEYDNINSNQIFQAISFVLHEYPLYIRQINCYLISWPENNE